MADAHLSPRQDSPLHGPPARASRLRSLDRAAAVLLALASAGHGFLGTLASGPILDSRTVWSFSGSVAAWLVAALNWLRSGRPGDRALAAWATAGALAWAGLMVWLAFAANMLTDPRPWLFVVVSGVLAAFGLRDLVSARSSRTR